MDKALNGITPATGNEAGTFKLPEFEFSLILWTRTEPLINTHTGLPFNESQLMGRHHIDFKAKTKKEAEAKGAAIWEMVRHGMPYEKYTVKLDPRCDMDYYSLRRKIKAAKEFKPAQNGDLTFKIAYSMEGLFSGKHSYHWGTIQSATYEAEKFLKTRHNKQRRKPYTAYDIVCLDELYAPLLHLEL